MRTEWRIRCPDNIRRLQEEARPFHPPRQRKRTATSKWTAATWSNNADGFEDEVVVLAGYFRLLALHSA
jgi:hypothetical protein